MNANPRMRLRPFPVESPEDIVGDRTGQADRSDAE